MRFARWSWAVTGLTMVVIAGGAVVRATGSGAGCGSHWPRCNGELVPFSGSTATTIEFLHRATSGVALLAVVVLAFWARRLFGRGHRVRTASAAAVAFIVGEVLIGAALVSNEWVGDDASVGRAVVDGFHLLNTFLLLGALTLAAWFASGRRGPSLGRSREVWMMGAALIAVLVVAAIGALTALGDTLFPEATIGDDFSSSSHFLVRLRWVHPVLAMVTAGYVLVLARLFGDEDEPVGPTARLAGAIVIAQLGAGFLNLALQAPLWLQVLHLLAADLLWVSLVILAASVLAVHRETAAEVPA